MKFIEVYSTEDKDKLIKLGYKLLKSTEVYGGQKYTFVNVDDKHLTFENMKFNLTNQLHF